MSYTTMFMNIEEKISELMAQIEIKRQEKASTKKRKQVFDQAGEHVRKILLDKYNDKIADC